jgi:hypothetical protein
MKKLLNPFDFWTGANFKLKIRKVEGYWNYDKSEFEKPSALLDDDDKLEKIYKNLNDLNEFSAASNFKTYDELKSVWTMCWEENSLHDKIPKLFRKKTNL